MVAMWGVAQPRKAFAIDVRGGRTIVVAVPVERFVHLDQTVLHLGVHTEPPVIVYVVIPQFDAFDKVSAQQHAVSWRAVVKEHVFEVGARRHIVVQWQCVVQICVVIGKHKSALPMAATCLLIFCGNQMSSWSLMATYSPVARSRAV